VYQIPLTEKPESWGKSSIFIKKGAVESGLFQCDPGLSLPLHAHDEGDEYIYLFQGEARFVVGDEEFDAKPGQLVKAPKGVMHRCSNVTDRPFVCFYLVCH